MKVVKFLNFQISPNSDKIDKCKTTKERIKTMISSVKSCLIVTLIIWSFATLNRIYETSIFLSGGSRLMMDFWAVTFSIQAIIMSSRGMIYSFIYCRYNPLKDIILCFFNKIFFCCKKTPKGTQNVENLIKESSTL